MQLDAEAGVSMAASRRRRIRSAVQRLGGVLPRLSCPRVAPPLFQPERVLKPKER